MFSFQFRRETKRILANIYCVSLAIITHTHTCTQPSSTKQNTNRAHNSHRWHKPPFTSAFCLKIKCFYCEKSTSHCCNAEHPVVDSSSSFLLHCFSFTVFFSPGQRLLRRRRRRCWSFNCPDIDLSQRYTHEYDIDLIGFFSISLFLSLPLHLILSFTHSLSLSPPLFPYWIFHRGILIALATQCWLCGCQSIIQQTDSDRLIVCLGRSQTCCLNKMFNAFSEI